MNDQPKHRSERHDWLKVGMLFVAMLTAFLGVTKMVWVYQTQRVAEQQKKLADLNLRLSPLRDFVKGFMPEMSRPARERVGSIQAVDNKLEELRRDFESVFEQYKNLGDAFKKYQDAASDLSDNNFCKDQGKGSWLAQTQADRLQRAADNLILQIDASCAP